MNKKDLRNLFEDSLGGILGKLQIDDLLEDYLEIEEKWICFFKKIDSINLVIIAEAPLNSKQYILNKNAKDSIFLYKRTLEKCIDVYKENPVKNELTKIDLMRELGIIVIEAYPFALDPKKHKNNYENLDPETKKHLFKTSYPWHLKKKLEIMKSKTTPNTVFSYRYDRNKDFIDFIDTDINFIYIGDAGKGRKSYGATDEDKLVNIFSVV